jgi:hypothetical protein
MLEEALQVATETILFESSTAVDLLHLPSKLEIIFRQAAGAVRAQIHGDFVPGVGPVRMVVHLFGGDGDPRHESEGGREILELEDAVQVPVHHPPAAEFSQFRRNFLF